MIPREAIEGKHEALVSRADFLKINSIETKHPKVHKTDNDNLPLKRFVNRSSCGTPLTGFLVKRKRLYYYKCRTKGCGCTKSAKQLHNKFINELSYFEIDPKFNSVIKDIMIYTYDAITKEIRENDSNIKKQLTLLSSKIDTIEECFAIGEIDVNIYQKFRGKYTKEHAHLKSSLGNSSISSSKLNLAIEKALTMSSKLSSLWESGYLFQKQKIQNLVFPSGIDYDKSKGKVQTKRVKSIFFAIPLLAEDIS
ncbi:MAG: hypothetical protein ACON5F_14670 [Jejuia sp.]